jgi:hypothetical protein
MDPQPTAAGSQRDALVAAAKKHAVKLKNSSYKLGGKSESALDCSDFVCLTLQRVLPDDADLSSASISGSADLILAKKPSPDDVIYFPAGKVPYQVNRVDSANVGVVLQSNLRSALRTPAYCSYRRLDAAQARASGPSLRHNFA